MGKDDFDLRKRLFTDRFLKCCYKHNIRLVSINKPTEKIEGSKNWSKLNFPYKACVFADGCNKQGWQLIWDVVNELKINGGCGNKGQNYIKWNAFKYLNEGVYEFNNKWQTIE